MSANSESLSPPRFEVYATAPDDVKSFLQILEQSIYARPDLYRAALTLYGLAANDQSTAVIVETARHIQSHPEDAEDIGSAYDNWVVYFKQRLDGFHEFDPATEEAWRNNEARKTIAANNELTKEQKRDRNRNALAATFLGRVALFQQQQQEQISA